jgi:hypothetical protein
MKASHFEIGKQNGDMINPKPVPPVEPTQILKNFDI